MLVAFMGAALAARIAFWVVTNRAFEDGLTTITHARNVPLGLGLVHTFLALFFAYHVLWRGDVTKGVAANVDWISALIAVAAAIALLRYQRNVIHVIAACAAAGLAVRLIGA